MNGNETNRGRKKALDNGTETVYSVKTMEATKKKAFLLMIEMDRNVPNFYGLFFDKKTANLEAKKIPYGFVIERDVIVIGDEINVVSDCYKM